MNKLSERSRSTNLESLYKGVKIIPFAGDITKLNVDAIVNAANSQLWMGGGVAGAIKRAGGEEIEREALKQAPVPVGKAVATTAGRLKSKWVIHAPTMERPAMAIDKENVALAARAALRCSDQIGAKTIAIPALGTGVGGVPKDIAAKTMISTIINHIDEKTGISEIILCDISREQISEFEKILQKTLV